jgi:hypothetical protein
LEIDSSFGVDSPSPAAARTRVPRALRDHALLAAVIACLLIGGGLRLVPNGTAASSGSAGAGSTACEAK